MTHQIRTGAALVALGVIGGAPFAALGADAQRDANHVYEITCHYCHDNGIGLVLKGAQIPAERIRLAVRQGYVAMPAFMPSYISDAELAALIELLTQPAAPAAAAAAGTRP
jgi:cytochrome c5